MQVLFIGGTGTSRTAYGRLALVHGIELALLTRGRGQAVRLDGARDIDADLANADAIAPTLGDEVPDTVVEVIGDAPADVDRDVALFTKRCHQHVFLGSASVYQKPLAAA